MLKNKKAQIGSTMTWVVATLVIIVILLFSIFIVSKLSIFKKGGQLDFDQNTEGVSEKSLYSYLLTKDNSGVIIYNKIKQDGNLSDFSGKLALQVFDKLYEKEYPAARWFGIKVEGIGGINPGHYFIRAGSFSFQTYLYDFHTEEIYLDNGREIHLIFLDKEK